MAQISSALMIIIGVLYCCLIKCSAYRWFSSYLQNKGRSPFRTSLTLNLESPKRHHTDTFGLPSIYKVEEDPLIPIIETVVKISDARKARQMAAFRVSHLTSTTTFMMIIEGICLCFSDLPYLHGIVLSKAQSEAVVDGIEKKLLEVHNRKLEIVNGKPSSGWQFLDYGDILINVMSTEMMNYYQLDRKWKNAEFLDLSYLRSPKKTVVSSSAVNGSAAPTILATARSREREDWSDSRLSRLALGDTEPPSSSSGSGGRMKQRVSGVGNKKVKSVSSTIDFNDEEDDDGDEGEGNNDYYDDDNDDELDENEERAEYDTDSDNSSGDEYEDEYLNDDDDDDQQVVAEGEKEIQEDEEPALDPFWS